MKLPIDIAVAISIFNIIKTVEANKINNSKLLIDISSFELLTNVKSFWTSKLFFLLKYVSVAN